MSIYLLPEGLSFIVELHCMLVLCKNGLITMSPPCNSNAILPRSSLVMFPVLGLFLTCALISLFEYLSTTVIKGLLTSDSKNFVLQVKLMCSYCRKHKETEVPDPYYGGPQGFEKVSHKPKDFLLNLLHLV